MENETNTVATTTTQTGATVPFVVRLDGTNDQEGRALLAEAALENVHTEATMLAGKADGVSPDQSVTRQTLAAIRQFASTRPTVYLPAHDPDGAARFAKRQAVPVAMSRAA